MVVTCANDALRGEFAAIKKFKNEVRFHAFNAQSRWHANNFLSWVKILGKQWETQNNIWWTCSTSDSVSSISWNLSLGPLGHDEMCRLWTSMLYAYVRKPRKSWLFLSLDFLGLMHSIGSLDQRYRNHGHPARGKYEPVYASRHLTTRQFPSCNRDKQRCVCLIWHSFFAWISDRARNNPSNQYVRNYINKTGRFAI